MLKKMGVVFLAAFILNVIWENLHSVLYVGYMGGKITEYILLRAAVWDAVIITALVAPFIAIPSLQKKSWLIVLIGFVIAVCIEWYALGTGRWAYTEHMPIVPLLNVGLTPFMQLGFLGYLAYLFTK